jgi:hypothetical protein
VQLSYQCKQTLYPILIWRHPNFLAVRMSLEIRDRLKKIARFLLAPHALLLLSLMYSFWIYPFCSEGFIKFASLNDAYEQLGCLHAWVLRASPSPAAAGHSRAGRPAGARTSAALLIVFLTSSSRLKSARGPLKERMQ